MWFLHKNLGFKGFLKQSCINLELIHLISAKLGSTIADYSICLISENQFNKTIKNVILHHRHQCHRRLPLFRYPLMSE